MSNPRRIIVVANAKSGSAGGDALDQLSAALCALGVAVDCWRAEQPNQLPTLAARAAAAAPDVLVAFGGDGTVNTVANALAGSTVAMGIAPRGTFNYVAKRYGLPSAVDEVAALLARGRATAIGAGEVNGKLFLNNCSFGLYADVIEARERHKAQWGRSRVVAVLSALATTLSARARLPLRITDPTTGLSQVRRASMVFAGVNPAQFEDGGFALSEEVAGGAVGVVVVDALNPWRVLRMLLGAAAGTVEDLQHIEAFPAQRLEIAVSNRLRPLKVVLDGEILRLLAPLRLRYRPNALRLLLPAAFNP